MSADLSKMAGHPVGDNETRQSFIARSVWLTIPGATLAAGAAYWLLPPLRGLEDTAARLALAARWLVVAVLPYVGVCLHIMSARFFEGSHDPLAGAESERLRIHCRVMQNTLEQLVWFAIGIAALATYASAAQARIVPILCVLFALARLVYWRGYLQEGTLGRAPGVQLTAAINVPLVLGVVALLVRSIAAG